MNHGNGILHRTVHWYCLLASIGSYWLSLGSIGLEKPTQAAPAGGFWASLGGGLGFKDDDDDDDDDDPG